MVRRRGLGEDTPNLGNSRLKHVVGRSEHKFATISHEPCRLEALRTHRSICSFDSKNWAGVRCINVKDGSILLKEVIHVAGDALKVEDSTWDAEVMKASELVMVDFWAVWCGPCQMVAPIVDELAQEYAGKLKVRKLNTDENPEVAGRYQVMSIPTILFFKNGRPVEKLVGARPKRQFKEMIDSLLAQHAGTA
jgi:thioredoxin 1